MQGGYVVRVRGVSKYEVDVGMVVWSTGLMQTPFITRLTREPVVYPVGGTETPKALFGVMSDPKTGGVLTDDKLRLRLHASSPTANTSPAGPATEVTTMALQDVYAIGDCAVE